MEECGLCVAEAIDDAVQGAGYIEERAKPREDREKTAGCFIAEHGGTDGGAEFKKDSRKQDPDV